MARMQLDFPVVRWGSCHLMDNDWCICLSLRL